MTIYLRYYRDVSEDAPDIVFFNRDKTLKMELLNSDLKSQYVGLFEKINRFDFRTEKISFNPICSDRENLRIRCDKTLIAYSLKQLWRQIRIKDDQIFLEIRLYMFWKALKSNSNT